MPYQWKTSLSEDGNLISGFIHDEVTYQGNALFAAQREGKEGNSLVMLSGTSGEILWEFDDFFETQKSFFSIRNLYHQDGHLVFQDGRQFYHLDLATGNILQKEEKNYEATRLRGMDELYLVSNKFELADDGLFEGSIIAGNVITMENEPLITPSYSREHLSINNAVGLVGSATPFRDDSSGDMLITYDYSDVVEDGGINTYIGLYNFSKREHIYEQQPLALGIDSYGSSIPAVYEDKVYYAPGRTIVCLDLYSGEQIWKKSFPEGFTFSGFILAEDKIIANNEDTYLYALDPDTGRQLWKTKSSGTSSRMTHMNGVVYYTGGGDGLLHAVEVETGKHLWRLRSPDLKNNNGAWFKNIVRVIPPENDEEKGKILVSSYLSAFCYEAAR
ncbi:MAG: PQQ-binding-like beta-propeller repeat protein [Cyclobacteriaceae bacterium]